MGLRPYLGRLFAPGDDSVAKPVAVMTYSCWKRLGSDPNISGKEIAGLHHRGRHAAGIHRILFRL